MNKQGLALLELLEKSSLLEPQALPQVQCFFELNWKYAGLETAAVRLEPEAAHLLLPKKKLTMDSISANVTLASQSHQHHPRGRESLQTTPRHAQFKSLLQHSIEKDY